VLFERDLSTPLRFARDDNKLCHSERIRFRWRSWGISILICQKLLQTYLL